jgi:hypothetical protein
LSNSSHSCSNINTETSGHSPSVVECDTTLSERRPAAGRRAPAFGRNLADIAGVTDGWIGCGSPRASVRTQPDGDRCVCSSSQRVPTHQAIGACQRSPAFDSDRRASPAHRGYGADGHGCRCGVLACDAAPLRAPRKGSVPGSDVWFAAIPCALPLIPPAPFSHKGRRGRLGVLMPETGEERHCRGADGD